MVNALAVLGVRNRADAAAIGRRARSSSYSVFGGFTVTSSERVPIFSSSHVARTV